MKKIVVLLLLTNLVSLSIIWYFKEQYNEYYNLVKLKDVAEELNQEYLLVTSIVDKSGYERFFATPTIFRSINECEKNQISSNKFDLKNGLVWSCNKYQY